MLKWSFILLIPVFWMANNLQKNGIDVTAEEPATCKSYYNKALKKQVYTQYELEPQFPGGSVAYARYINKNMKCPQEMIDNPDDLPSSVHMTFIVDESGNIIDPQMARKEKSSYTAFDKEFIKMLKAMPKWSPAICQGKKVTAEVKRSTPCIKWETEE
ncbi:MAG: hypothetical protein J7621_00275 [Niastella sp.]|nr:hypothetical protein [Niastella sp.]